ncbi:hypothetical protein [Paraburkholderia hayleyella]|uniref:hypothetical protein n=1 Tax=Paraburkholderia hayleyella TaxID=2152889 RepID=UPI001C65A25F|nr:hypothetical protein [Paraburkholderia hayleyella]
MKIFNKNTKHSNADQNTPLINKNEKTSNYGTFNNQSCSVETPQGIRASCDALITPLINQAQLLPKKIFQSYINQYTQINTKKIPYKANDGN